MERTLLMTGIGGQGIQLSAQVLVRAALAEGRHVQLFGSYGGMMRGGNTDAAVVVGDRPIESPPTIETAWSAIVMHHEYWAAVRDRLGPTSLVLVNSSVFTGEVDRHRHLVVDVPATGLAVEAGNAVAATMVMVGAFATATGMVTLDALSAAVAAALPSYRAQHVALNQAALRAGATAVPGPVAPAWAPGPAWPGTPSREATIR
jgi:Pyruvate/2-oxoacid:ferredoxin oxidoreductase gamma subunit